LIPVHFTFAIASAEYIKRERERKRERDRERKRERERGREIRALINIK
jgi:hypothetical protein